MKFALLGLAIGLGALLLLFSRSGPARSDDAPAGGLPIEQQLGKCLAVTNVAWGHDNQDKVWQGFFPGGPRFLQDLTQFVPGGGYLVNVSADCTVNTGSTSIDLYTGWNLFGWLTAPPTPPPAPTPTPTPAATPTPTPTPLPTATPTPAPPPAGYNFTGSGSRVTDEFDLQQGVAIFELTHDGASNFIVWLIDGNGELVELLANEIGSFDGAMAIRIHASAIFAARPGVYRLEITADGAWSVNIRQPTYTSAPGAPRSFSGAGPSVSGTFTLEEGLAIFTLTHDGSGNFIVSMLAVDGSDAELLVNEIGPFDGQNAVGVGPLFGPDPGIHILTIDADGNWSVDIEQP
ncbi:MAG: hypothetical protein ACE5IZ_08815 [Dehalococcoidia bacterium]